MRGCGHQQVGVRDECVLEKGLRVNLPLGLQLND